MSGACPLRRRRISPPRYRSRSPPPAPHWPPHLERDRSGAISGLATRAAVISITRLINQGLVLVSPIILVRVLSVEQFGRYREFLLYATILVSIASFGINSSLLRFIPSRPEHGWRFVDQTIVMTFTSSLLVAAGALLLNAALGGELLGDYPILVTVYVFLFVNLDFWEYYWLAEKRSLAVFAYTTGRLVARLVVVIATAYLSRDVDTIVWALVSLEAVRLTISLLAWQARRQRTAAHPEGSWRELLKFCLPFGGSSILVVLNRSVGSLFVAKLMGPIALAHYSIGTYVQPVIAVLRNSLSDVLLPEMVEGGRREQADALRLFRSTTVVTAMALFAAGVVLAKFADVLITTFFSEQYRSAIIVFQLYLLVLIRESLDFGVPLRAINQTTPILRSNFVAILANIALAALLLPLLGLIGAVIAFVLSRTIEGAYLGVQTLHAYRVGWRDLCSWADLGKVALAACLAAPALYGSFWTETFGILGAAAGGLLYLFVFMALLWLLRVPEFLLLVRRLKSAPQALLMRSQGRS